MALFQHTRGRMLTDGTVPTCTWRDANWWHCSNIHVEGC